MRNRLASKAASGTTEKALSTPPGCRSITLTSSLPKLTGKLTLRIDPGPLTLVDSSISNAGDILVPHAKGGGVHAEDLIKVNTVSDNMVRATKSTRGGGISNVAFMELTDNKITGNSLTNCETNRPVDGCV